ncbi:FAD:protein FMN transferase [Pengzhenrongella phosphoraccumulans]|uniref:FAD:protein FMN transferase n=1 Tax=Pengzhenrongella phosphoraccumulans TaxID=3114394 RepID=UPI00388F86D7
MTAVTASGGAGVIEPAGADHDRHRAWVEQIMGMPISVHVRGAGARGSEAAEAAAKLFADLREVDRIFSTYKDDSEISRLGRGELTLEQCDPAVREVHRLCEVARERTDGYVDAWAVPGHPGRFDPTVLVKSWAVARAARHFEQVPALALAVGAGGDILVTPGDEPDPWIIGIQDPNDRGAAIATVPVHDGGIATSGLAARGAHIFDPHTGAAVTEVVSATVIGPSLMWADVWATAVVARGAGAIDWLPTLHGTTGLLVLADGTVHRWQNAE